MQLPDFVDLRPEEKDTILNKLDTALDQPSSIAQQELVGPVHHHRKTIPTIGGSATVEVTEIHRAIQGLNPSGEIIFQPIEDTDVIPSLLPHHQIHDHVLFDNSDIAGLTVADLTKQNLLSKPGFNLDTNHRRNRRRKSKLIVKGDPNYRIPKDTGWHLGKKPSEIDRENRKHKS